MSLKVVLAGFVSPAVVLLSLSAHHYYHWSPLAAERRSYLSFRVHPIIQMRQFATGFMIAIGALVWQKIGWVGFEAIFGISSTLRLFPRHICPALHLHNRLIFLVSSGLDKALDGHGCFFCRRLACRNSISTLCESLDVLFAKQNHSFFRRIRLTNGFISSLRHELAASSGHNKYAIQLMNLRCLRTLRFRTIRTVAAMSC